MKKLIQSIKAKPAHIRDRIVFLTAGTVAGLVGIVWFTGFVMSAPLAFSGESTWSGGSAVTAPLADISSVIQQNVAAVTGAFSGLTAEEQASQSGEARVEVVDKGGTLPSEEINGEASLPTTVTF